MNEKKANHTLTMGKRLAELRKTLSLDTNEDWSQHQLAKELRVTQTVIARIERGLGTINTFVNILLFFHSKGYNILWVLIPNNAIISKYAQQEQQHITIQKALQIIQEHILGK